MTSDPSATPDGDERISIPISAIKEMLERATDHENKATMKGDRSSADWWGGYGLALRHIFAIEKFQRP